MTVDTILNYFLKAGASFRNSFAWWKQHEDEHGETRVLRSGRFGIGVLAGFLLGREIQVTTRHVTAQAHEGLTFTCRLEDEHIQIDRISRPVGTTVSIQISESVYESLLNSATAPDEVEDEDDDFHWDWYCLAEPSVRRVIPTGPVPQKYILPEADSTLPPDWRRIQHPDYRDVHWSYIDDTRELTCNGVAIKSLSPVDDWARYYQNSDYDRRFRSDGLVCPNLSIFDPNGNLPLNLQRTALSVNALPFEKELVNDICLDVLASLLVYTPKRRPSNVSSAIIHYGANSNSHPAIAHDFSHFYADKGLALLTPWHVQKLKTKSIFVFTNHSLLKVLGIKSFQPHVPSESVHGLDTVLDAIASGLGWLTTRNYRLIGSWSFMNEVEDKYMNRYGTYLPLSGREEWSDGGWKVIANGKCPDLRLNLDEYSV